MSIGRWAMLSIFPVSVLMMVLGGGLGLLMLSIVIGYVVMSLSFVLCVASVVWVVVPKLFHVSWAGRMAFVGVAGFIFPFLAAPVLVEDIGPLGWLVAVMAGAVGAVVAVMNAGRMDELFGEPGP